MRCLWKHSPKIQVMVYCITSFFSPLSSTRTPFGGNNNKYMYHISNVCIRFWLLTHVHDEEGKEEKICQDLWIRLHKVFFFFFLSHFQRYGSTNTKNLQPSLFHHFLFSCIYSHFSPLTSISFLIWSIHLVLGLPVDRFSSIFVCSIFSGILSFVIRITWPNHLTLLFKCHFLFHLLLVLIFY